MPADYPLFSQSTKLMRPFTQMQAGNVDAQTDKQRAEMGRLENGVEEGLACFISGILHAVPHSLGNFFNRRSTFWCK